MSSRLMSKQCLVANASYSLRKGVFDIDETHLGLTICLRHREIFGIRWRSNKTNCTAPSQWVSHKTVKAERGITLAHSKLLRQHTQVLLPVGSQICRQCRRKLQTASSVAVATIDIEEASAQATQETVEGTPTAQAVAEQETIDIEEASVQTTETAAENIEVSGGEKKSLNKILFDTLLLFFFTASYFTDRTLHNDEKQSDVEQLCGAMLHLSINAGSTYEPGSQDSSSSDTSNDNGSHHTRSLAVQRLLLNEFLRSCDAGTIGPYKKQWNEASARTRNSHVCKAKALVVAGLNVITPGDAGFLWEALKESGTVEKELGTGEQQEDRRYLEALAESYHNASCWETRRQILSIMVDLITFKRMQFYIPGLTEYRFKMARQHLLEHGRGAVVPHTRSPRMRVESKQLDHFLMYITSPHVIQDLPFGQRYLHLSSGRILETPNVIRTMVPNRLAKQYQAYCKETGFTPFSQATMLRILSACSATVRNHFRGLDYIAADGAKGFEDLCEMIGRLEERGLDSETVKIWKRTLKEGKQYLKFDYK
ncbi:hypothetical protein QZH41_014983, partial [Actinostola sp. cb2023]